MPWEVPHDEFYEESGATYPVTFGDGLKMLVLVKKDCVTVMFPDCQEDYIPISFNQNKSPGYLAQMLHDSRVKWESRKLSDIVKWLTELGYET